MRSSFRFESVRNKTKLSHMVLNNFKKVLIDGTLKPGDKLPPLSELANQMEVGISSVREAVKMLEGLGILESRQGDGTFVIDDLENDAFDMLSLQLMLMPRSNDGLVGFRRMYETAYTYMAMQNATAEDFEILESLVADQESRAKYTHLGASDERDFHFAILNCTHNPYVIRIGHSLVELFLSTIPESGVLLSELSMTNDHRNILEAMRSKDNKRLDSVLEKSFSGWGQRLSGENYEEEIYTK